MILLLNTLFISTNAQSPNFLTGYKTGNVYQEGVLIGLGNGNAGLSAPMTAHNFITLQFYYGDGTVLSSSGVVTPSTITASRTLNVLNLLSAGADAYIQFRNTSNANLASGTTVYFKLGTAPSVSGLGASVGGLLGLSNVYAIQGRGYSGAANYSVAALSPGSENPGTASGSQAGTLTQLLVDKNGIWHAGVTPDAGFNSVRLNVAFSQSLDLLGVNRDLAVKVYNAFYYNVPGGINCGIPIFTTPGEVDGVNLNLGSALSLAALDTAVVNPSYAIDENNATYSRMTSGVLGIANTISQTVLFNGTGTGSDAVKIRLALPSSALTASLLNNITVTAYNKTTQVGSAQPVSALLTLDVLGLLSNNTPFDVNFQPGGPFDRVKIALGGLVSIGSSILGGGVRIYEVTRIANAPVISFNPLNDTVCSGGAASFNVTASGTINSYTWEYYNGGTWLTAGNGNPLVISNTNTSMDGRKYRVKITGGDCPTSQTSITSSEATLVVRALPHTPPLSMSP